MLDGKVLYRSRLLLQLEPEASTFPLRSDGGGGGGLPLCGNGGGSNSAGGGGGNAPPAAPVPALPPVALRVLPLCDSPTPIGYIYDAAPDPTGGLLTAALVFFSHQGHQVVHNPCPDISAYRSALGRGATVIPVDNLSNHFLSSGLDLLDGLFSPSPVDTLKMSSWR